MNPNDWLIVIPARLASERLANKPLADLAGKPLIVRVFENLTPLRELGIHTIVAVDDPRTAKACQDFKIPSLMTSPLHQSGTDRCFEVAAKFMDRKFILNVQGDEPFISCEDLQSLMILMTTKKPQMATLGYKSSDGESYTNPNVVKIALSDQDQAIYFSRAPIPYDRQAMTDKRNSIAHIQHVGTYAYTQESLKEFCKLAPSSLEKTEKLEQLRAISAGWKILVATAKSKSIGIDTPEDLKRAREVLNG